MGLPLNAGMTIILAFCICVLDVLVVAPIFHICLSKTLSELDVIGLTIDFILLVIIIAWFVFVEDSLIKRYISAKIKKICPRIEWVNKDNNNQEI